MPWAKVDDKLHSHPKAMQAGLEALGLHVLAMSYVAGYETDGLVPAWFVDQKADAGIADRLVHAGLWELSPGGYMIHDWLKYNPSKAQAKRLAAAKRKAGKAGGEARAGGQANGLRVV